MREILFCGKRTDNGEWVEGFYVWMHNGRGLVSHRIYTGYAESDSGDFYPDWYEVDPDTLCRCTGLYDRYDKAIYEDDIVESRDFDEEEGYGRVEWDKESARFVVKGNYLTKDFYNICGWELVVIGNMHDNAALWEAYHDG